MKAFYKTDVLGARKHRLIVDGRRLKTEKSGFKNIQIRVYGAFSK